jgi:leucyl aminopeptidase
VILLQIPERRQPADVVVVGLSADLDPGAEASLQLDAVSTTALPMSAAQAAAAYVTTERPTGDAGALHTVTLPGEVPSTILIAGLGDGGAGALRIAAVAIGRAIRRRRRSDLVNVALDAPRAEVSRALAEGLVLGGHEFSRKSDDDEQLHTLDLIGRVDADGIAAGENAADAACWARDLGNMPASELDPARLGELAVQELTPAGCRVQVREPDWLAEHGFGAVLAVGGGSASGPRLIEATYRPRRTAGSRGASPLPHVVLVGKGITFDSGGLNLKPVPAMRLMHTDMCGGAAVLGAIQYAAMQRLPIRVTALVPTAENAVSGTAMRPSDVITHVGGRTTEVGNTDAEGRLVLADALAYAVARLDVATLTGAMKVALGMETGGYFANDDALAGALESAAAEADEALWRMPLEHRYARNLASDIADARNDPSGPGGITAALFLQPFVGEVAWAHLDIAGPARALEEGALFGQGATGFGTRLLTRYLESASA